MHQQKAIYTVSDKTDITDYTAQRAEYKNELILSLAFQTNIY